MPVESFYTHAGAWIRHQAEPLRVPAANADALHDQRVASRRLRTACAVFPKEAGGRRLAKALKALTRLLGIPRQWDVQEALLARLRQTSVDPGEQAAVECLQERARKRRKKAWKEIQAHRVAKSLLNSLEDFAHRLEAREDKDEVPALARKALQPVFEDSFGALEGLWQAEDPDGMHEVRRAFKRFRYTLELLQPAFPEGQEGLLAQARKVQTRLGDHHDQVVLQAFLQGERKRLEKQGTATLCGGLLEALRRVEGEREGLYQSFKADGARLSVAETAQALWRAIGVISMPPTAPQNREVNPEEPVSD